MVGLRSMKKQPEIIEADYCVIGERPKREPFFGPLPNILAFLAFILSGLLIRAWAHYDHARVIAHTQQVHSVDHSESTH